VSVPAGHGMSDFEIAFLAMSHPLSGNESREALRYLRDYITAGADTIPGTPGREALEKVAEHSVEARAALDRVE
jgi:hypothetical protein